ncbi:hypothetical protein BKA67DRAFT_358591 [Truncatella angustata]|uniref:Uncharacterized protein n=1 Tax=Truncatella angustata TaxID=152316 RepID=A0A9P8UE45_9PEZI|nr:uncharacterized protein BKA67DRAFT_358591 [Truncatella angustata]KAH6648270.1 hypothetical protein BKA67DRAFT_358591 [Truncatella angustata]
MKTMARTQLAGHIAWLPRMNTPGIDLSLDPGCYDHPVVILSPRVTVGKVVILTMTSFGDTDLVERHKHARKRRPYLPVFPASPHPDNGIILYLEDLSLPLHRNGWIDTSEPLTVRFDSLIPYNEPEEDFTLSRASYQQLIGYSGFGSSLGKICQVPWRSQAYSPPKDRGPLGADSGSISPNTLSSFYQQSRRVWSEPLAPRPIRDGQNELKRRSWPLSRLRKPCDEEIGQDATALPNQPATNTGQQSWSMSRLREPRDEEVEQAAATHLNRPPSTASKYSGLSHGKACRQDSPACIPFPLVPRETCSSTEQVVESVLRALSVCRMT